MEIENGAGSAGKTGTEERVQVAGTWVSSVSGRSVERSGAGVMFTNDDLTDGNSPSYQSLVYITPAPLRSPLRLITEETPVPATRTLSSVTVLPAEPALFYFSTKNRALPACKSPHL